MGFTGSLLYGRGMLLSIRLGWVCMGCVCGCAGDESLVLLRFSDWVHGGAVVYNRVA